MFNEVMLQNTTEVNSFLSDQAVVKCTLILEVKSIWIFFLLISP